MDELVFRLKLIRMRQILIEKENSAQFEQRFPKQEVKFLIPSDQSSVS